MSLGSRALALSVRLFWPLMFVSMALFQSYVVFEVCLASWKGLGVFLYPILGTVFVLVIAHLLLSYILTALTDPGKAPLASWVVPSGESLARLESDATLFDHLTRSDADKNRAALERIKESLVPPEYLVFYCEFCRAPKPPRTHHCRFAFVLSPRLLDHGIVVVSSPHPLCTKQPVRSMRPSNGSSLVSLLLPPPASPKMIAKSRLQSRSSSQ